MENQRLESIAVYQETQPRHSKKLKRAIAVTALSLSASVALLAAETNNHSANDGKNIVNSNQIAQAQWELDHIKAAQQAIAAQRAQEKAKQQADLKRKFEVAIWFKAIKANNDKLQAQTYSASDQEFLRCTRAHESDTAGGYHAVSPDGVYYGAYQFLIPTWNNTAIHDNRPDLVGVRPDQASPADQDSLAIDLYHWQGNAPWAGRC